MTPRGSAPGDMAARGWTLLELLVALAAAGVLIGTAVLGAGAFLARLELRAGALRTAGAALRARSAAVREGRAWALAAGTRSLVAGPVGGEPRLVVRLPPRVRLVRATSGGEVRFDPTGRAENATFTLALDGGRDGVARVVVNQRGRVRVE